MQAKFDTTIVLNPANAPQFGHYPKARDKFEAPAFWGVWEDCVLESKAGNHVNENMVWEDAYHASNAETLQQWSFTASVANTRNIDGEKVAEYMVKAEDSAFESYYDNAKHMAITCGDRDFPSREEAREALAGEIVEYMVWRKFVWTTWFGGRVEETVAEAMCDHFGVDRWYAMTEDLEARGIENPEPRGIDLFFPNLGEDGLTVQVKRGDGGRPRNCEADVLARYHEDSAEIDLTPL